MPRKKTLDQLLASAKLPERAITVCLRGDLVAEFQRLEDQLEQHDEQKVKDRRLAGSKKGREIAEAMETVRAQMREHSLPLTLRAFPGHEWRALKDKHPMADDPDQRTPEDTIVRANAKTLFNAAVRPSIVDPEFTDEQWTQFDAVLPDGEFSRIVDAIYTLNESAVVVPKSQRASITLRMSADD